VRIDLSGADVVDNHCHPFRSEELLARSPEDFETRLTLMGMCFMSSSGEDAAMWAGIRRLTDHTMYSLIARRWLAERLGCSPTPENIWRARDAAIRSDPPGYIRALLDDQHIAGLVTDNGYPLPAIPFDEFQRAVGGVPVHGVVRIEPLIAELREQAADFDALEQALEARLEEAAGSEGTVAFKSIIAYRTGLDVEEVSRDDARRSFKRWRESGWSEARPDAKPVRDRLMEVVAVVAGRRGLALHVHTGDGDPDIDLRHARPSELFPFLRRHLDQPIVLIHGGHPWSHEAAYIAALLPNVYVDLSVLIPWAGSAIERLIADLVATVPMSKLLYGSDEASEPEVLWISARLARRALERVLSDAVDDDYLTFQEAEDAGRGILAGNTSALHGL
jgi:predicted TIM-barrel fold metal-dependent hydrolase